ncbi:hypothetical protein ACWDPV_01830 [Gordonia sp. NPDC003504]
MVIRVDCHYRLDPHPRQQDFAAGFSARIADPLWFLTRQWQMGEMQGENASSPVRVDYSTVTTPIGPSPVAPDTDPTKVPAEAIIEDEDTGWWTMGRRLRIGRVLADLVGDVDAEYLFSSPPPPYENLVGAPDGLAMWRDPDPLGLGDAHFAAVGVPARRGSAWKSDELVYGAEFPTGGDGSPTLLVPRHRGGEVDWSSADASGAGFTGDAVVSHAYPAQLEYPGAPASRWWEIEDAAVDIGGYPPDSAHPVTAMLIQLICSHADDWFLFPIDVPAGHVSSLLDGEIEVTDSFGYTYTARVPDDWFMFGLSGADPWSLVVWLRALTPVEGPAVEEVLFGLDEYSNLLWAVEERIDGREAAPSSRSDEAPAAAALTVDPGARRYNYLPGTTPTPFWHAYGLDEVPVNEQLRRRLVQRRIADLSGEEPTLVDAPVAEVLRVHTADGEKVHEIEPATIPSIGTRIVRRHKLARDVDGNPCLWVERQRQPVLRPPSQHVRFDEFVERGLD